MARIDCCKESVEQTVTIRTRKERMEELCEKLTQASQKLASAQTEEEVTSALAFLTEVANQADDVNGQILELSKIIRTVKLYDTTRSAIIEMIDKLIEEAKKIIKEEAEKETARKIKDFCIWMSEHAEEIAKWKGIAELFS